MRQHDLAELEPFSQLLEQELAISSLGRPSAEIPQPGASEQPRLPAIAPRQQLCYR